MWRKLMMFIAVAAIALAPGAVRALIPQRGVGTYTQPDEAKPVGPGGLFSVANGGLANGKKAPDFSVETTDGKTVHLSDFKGRVIVIDFWSTWCGPCQESLPGTDRIAGIYQAKGVQFLPICSWDDENAFQSWAAKRKSWHMKFYYDPAGMNDDSVAAKLYGVSGIPTQFVIGADGKVVMSNCGYDGDDNEPDLRHAIDKALAAKGARPSQH